MDKIEEILRLADGISNPDGYLVEASKCIGDKEQRVLGKELCLLGLNKFPTHTRLRLLLARLFYLDGLTVMAARELAELKKYCQSETLDRLISSLGGEGCVSKKLNDVNKEGNCVEDEGDKNFQELIAEIDLDDDLIEMLDDSEE